MTIRLKEDSIIRRKSIFAVLPLLGLLLVFGLTTAYFRSDYTTTNEIIGTAPYITIRDEFTAPSGWEPGQTINTRFGITNNQDYTGGPISVRVKVLETWKDKNQNILSSTINNEDVVIKDLGNDWTKNGEFYYYKKVLNINEETTTLFNSLTLNSSVAPTVTCVDDNGVDECTGSGTYIDALYNMVLEYQLVDYNNVIDAWGFNPTL